MGVVVVVAVLTVLIVGVVEAVDAGDDALDCEDAEAAVVTVAVAVVVVVVAVLAVDADVVPVVFADVRGVVCVAVVLAIRTHTIHISKLYFNGDPVLYYLVCLSFRSIIVTRCGGPGGIEA